MKKTIFVMALFMATAFASRAQVRVSLDVILGNRQPNPGELALMNREEQMNPTVTQAMHQISSAINFLNAAPNDFGGHKDQAKRDLHQAWVSLRKALYYRIFVDTH